MKNLNNNTIIHMNPIHPHFAVIPAFRHVAIFNVKNLIEINPDIGETEF